MHATAPAIPLDHMLDSDSKRDGYPAECLRILDLGLP